MSDHLPEGIIVNIIRSLPVKTLLLCTSVCRSWYSLITSPQFVCSHLNYAKKGDHSLLLRRCVGDSEHYDLYSDKESFTSHATLEFPFRSTNSFFTIVGSCRGLLCLSDDRVYYMHTMILWNPCIKKSLLLPKPNLVYNSYGSGSFVQSLGFGYDPVGNDYKVVRITYVDCGRECPQVELYKLSTGVWQELNHLVLYHVIYNRSRHAYLHNSTHWIACCNGSCDLIVLFDMSAQVFREMLLPVSLMTTNPTNSRDLVVYMDSLALMTWNASSISVWVMREYGVPQSWTKHFNFDFHDLGGDGFMRPLWFRNNGEVVTIHHSGGLVSCDANGMLKDLGVHGLRSEDSTNSVHVDRFEESLVLVDGGPCFSDAITCSKLPALISN